MKKRVEWLDTCKGIATMFVIMVHIDCTPDIYRRIVSAFFLPAFYFVSGYFFSSQDNNKKIWIKEMSRLRKWFCAFFLLNFVNISVMSLLGKVFNKEYDFWERIKDFLLQFPGKNDSLWFLACLMVASLFFSFLVTIFRKNNYMLITSVVVVYIIGLVISNTFGVMYWHLDTALVATGYYALGYYYKLNANKIEKYINKKNLLILSLLYFIIIYFRFLVFDGNRNDMHLAYYGNIPLFVMSSFLGLGVFIILCQLVPQRKSIMFVGENSLFYYMFHGKVLLLLNSLSRTLGISKGDVLSYFITPVYIIITCIILVLPSIAVNKYFPIIVGKAGKKGA